MRHRVKELIAIKKVNISKNFNINAIIMTPKRQKHAQKHITQCIDH